MKKRILSIVCALALCIGLLPATALAAGNWTYAPKSGDQSYDSITRDGITIAVEHEADNPTNLIVTTSSSTESIPADGVVDLRGTITDSSGTKYTITQIDSCSYYITSLILPDTVTSVYRLAFFLKSNLQSITFPNNLTSIGEKAFEGCSALTAAELSGTKITAVPDYAFNQCASLTTVSLPEGLTSIGLLAFGECSNLASVNLPSTLTSIGGSAFYRCSALTEITIPSGVEAIGYRTFESCSSLSKVTLSEGLKSIGQNAFYSCTSLSEITIPSTVTSIEQDAFGSCSALQRLTVLAEVPPAIVALPNIPYIFVPETSVTAYKEASGWSSHADRIYPIGYDPGATYSISAAPASLDFGPLTAGEALPAAQTVTVSNTGTGTVEVSLPTSGKFTITEGTGFTNGKVILKANETATFTVQPKDVSTEGAVSETITITGTSVGATSAEAPTASVTASYTVAFPKVTVGGVELKAAPGGAAVYALTDDETGVVTTEGAGEGNYNIKWDGETLTLKGATIAVTGQHGIRSDADLILALEGNNSIRIDKQEGSPASYYGIHAGKDLTITGNGSLDITADSGAIRAAALTVRDAALSLVSQSSSGISADSMTVESGSVTARGQSCGISVTGALSVSAAAYLNARGDRAALEAGSITIAGTLYTEKVDNLKVVIENGVLTQTGVLYVNGVDILEDGAVLPQGVSYEQSTNTLTLTNAAIQEYYQKDRGFCGIYTNGDLNLALEGSSSISGRAILEREEFYGISVLGDLTISGTGNLEIAGAAGPEGTISYGIMPLDGFTLQSGSVTVTLGSCWQNMGLYGGTGVLVEGGALTIKPSAAPQTAGVSMGILSEAGSDDLNGKSAVHITGGTVSVEGNELLIPATAVNDSSSTGISASSILVEGGTVTARGGDITVEGTGAEATPTSVVLSFGIGAGKLVIQGGTVTAQCGQISCTDENIQTTRGAFFFEHDEDGYEAEKMLTVSPQALSAIAVKLGSAEADAAEIAGSPFTGKCDLSYDTLKQAAYFHSEVVAPLTLTADQTSLTGGGTVTLTVGGPLASQTDNLSLTCSDSSITVTGGPDVWTAALPNGEKEYTFTVTYTDDIYPDNITATCTVRTTHRSSGGGSSTTYSVSLPGKVEGGTVTASKRSAEAGETFRFTVTPDEGYELDSLTATDSRGTELDLKYEGNGEYSFKMPAGQVKIQATFREISAELPFTDVSEGAWYEDAVSYVYQHGLMAGTSATTFAPDATTSRSMIATILWRIAGSPVVDYAMDFADVPQGQWYSEAVRWAASEGIVSGYGNGTFGTNDSITREQFAAMLYRFAQEQGYDVSVGENTNILSYTDAEDVAEYAIPAMQWAVGAGIISGTGDGSTLSPQGQATRAQAAVMLMQFCENYVTW